MSKLHELREIEANIELMKARLAELAPQVEDRMALINLVLDECKAKGFDKKEIAQAICPELDSKTTAVASEKKTRKARVVKVYLNPHSGEVIETKGGNHNGLKAWKAKYGSEAVESWAQA